MSHKKSFADGFNFYKLFWIFFIGSIIGVIIETLWCYLRFGCVESRAGLVWGPFNPVYGFGALVMTLALKRLNGRRDLWIFVFGGVIGGAYEYLCSFFQEKVFGTISWDYAEFPLNLNGRINLLYCFFWGILALLWVKDTYPKISRLIEKIPNVVGKILTWILLIFMVANFIMSSCVVLRMTGRHYGIPAKNIFWEYIDENYPDERIRQIYPNMKFTIKK